MPKKAHTPTPETRKTVSALIGLGATLELVASTLSITVKRLQKVYREEIKMGPQAVAMDLRRTLFNASKAGDEPAQSRTNAAIKLLDHLAEQKMAELEAEEAKKNQLAKVYLQPDAEPLLMHECLTCRGDILPLYLADDSPAPQLYVRIPYNKRLFDSHPMTIRDAQRDGRDLNELFDVRGYKLEPVFHTTNLGGVEGAPLVGKDSGKPLLFTETGRPYIFVRSEPGDDKL
jgi:hypothetical protein